MWSHYAASHTGFVLEFNAHHSYFHEKRSDANEFRHLRRVLYREARPSSSFKDLEGPELFLVKSGHWAYEREWRILRALKEATETQPADPFPVCLFSFPREAVTAVIIGARATTATEVGIRNLLRSHESYRAVRLKRAVPDSSHFLLRFIDETL